MPKVSVVVPNYNYGRFLAQRLSSILAQSFRDFELLYLDDASTDESPEVVERFRGDPRLRTLRNEVNSGHAFRQFNAGVRLAQQVVVGAVEFDPERIEPGVGMRDGDVEAEGIARRHQGGVEPFPQQCIEGLQDQRVGL